MFKFRITFSGGKLRIVKDDKTDGVSEESNASLTEPKVEQRTMPDSIDETLGVPLEERRRLQQQAIAELEKDTEWERELNERNRSQSEYYSKEHHVLLSLADTANLPNSTGEDIELTLPEVFFLKYIDGRSTQIADYIPGYFTYSYHIDYKKTIDRLARGGYVSYANPEYALAKHKVCELREMLVEKGIKPRGKKQDLVNALLSCMTEEELNEVSKQYFSTTEEGKHLIEYYSFADYFRCHEYHFGISVEEAAEYKKNHPSESKYEMALAILKEHEKEALRRKSLFAFRTAIFGEAIVYSDTEVYAEAIISWVSVCYLDYLEDCRWGRLPLIAPHVVSNLREIFSSNPELDELYDEFFENALLFCTAALKTNQFEYIPHSITNFRRAMDEALYRYTKKSDGAPTID